MDRSPKVSVDMRSGEMTSSWWFNVRTTVFPYHKTLCSPVQTRDQKRKTFTEERSWRRTLSRSFHSLNKELSTSAPTQERVLPSSRKPVSQQEKKKLKSNGKEIAKKRIEGKPTERLENGFLLREDEHHCRSTAVPETGAKLSSDWNKQR